MTNLRKLLLGSACAALAITAFGTPAGAADTTGTLAIVNGIPGQKVDICIGSKEQRSGVRYGSSYRKDVIGTGAKLLRFCKYNPARKCGGKLIARKVLSITPGWDQTIVVTKFAPKVVMFDNASPLSLGEIPPRGTPYVGAPVAHRGAAEFPTNLHLTYWSETDDYPIGPSANPVWVKGDSYTSIYITNVFVKIRATWPEDPDVISSRTSYMKPGRRVEWILLGGNPGNAKMILLKRGVSNTSP